MLAAGVHARIRNLHRRATGELRARSQRSSIAPGASRVTIGGPKLPKPEGKCFNERRAKFARRCGIDGDGGNRTHERFRLST